MSCWVGLKMAGRLEGAILTVWARRQLLVGRCRGVVLVAMRNGIVGGENCPRCGPTA